jgi:hypothetical protein
MYKVQKKVKFNSTVKEKYILPYILDRNLKSIFLSVAAYLRQNK